MNFSDFTEKIIIKTSDRFVGSKHRIVFSLYYQPHISDSWSDGFINQISYSREEIEQMDIIKPYKQAWSKSEEHINQYYLFHSKTL